MPWEAWLTLGVVLIVVVLLALEVSSPAIVMLGGVVALLVSGVIEADAALSGFGNPAPVTVAALYVIAAGLNRTGVVHRLLTRVMGEAPSGRRSLGRLLLPSAAASAFVNNTPIVSMIVPAVSRWADRLGRPASALLMPLSFAAVLGGMVTVIGTSTHIVVSGLLEDAGLEAFSFFEVARMGLPVAIVGLVLLVLLAPVLLPARRSARRDIDDVREYTVEMRVESGGPIDGVTIGDASLRHLAGVFLAQVERREEVVGAIGPDFVLEGGDILRFVGNARNVADLHGRPGLEVETRTSGIAAGRMAFYEAVVGVGSPLVGLSLRDIGFRDRYRAVVLAIHRADQRVLGKLGDARLRVGDTLLVLAGPGFGDHWPGSGDFLMVARFDAAEPPHPEKSWVALAVAGLTIAVAASGVISILEAALLGALATVVTGVLTPGEARRSVDIDVVVLIAASFGVGAAVGGSGLAAEIAELLGSTGDALGDIGAVAGVVVLTILLTEAITNNGAAILVLPIALALAAESGLDPRSVAVAVSVSASASFLTPIGYQTNTMVWGPGGYRFGDYARLGAPITLATIAIVVALTV